MGGSDTRYPAAQAKGIALKLWERLKPVCRPGRIKIVGSLRREVDSVGDIEILYIPLFEHTKNLFGEADGAESVNLVDQELKKLIEAGVLALREKKNGQHTYGRRIKLLRHVGSGIPVDLFAANEQNWWNLLVCRTGGKANNLEIARRAQVRDMKWTPYGPGFQRHDGSILDVFSEKDVFEAVDMELKQPWERD